MSDLRFVWLVAGLVLWAVMLARRGGAAARTTWPQATAGVVVGLSLWWSYVQLVDPQVVSLTLLFQ